MTEPHHPNPDHQDDEAWLAHLAGREVAGAKPQTAHEARLLREWLKNNHQEAEPSSNAGLDQLLFKLKREGLLNKKKAHNWHNFIPAALVATLTLSIGITIMPWGNKHPVDVRGPDGAPMPSPTLPAPAIPLPDMAKPEPMPAPTQSHPLRGGPKTPMHKVEVENVATARAEWADLLDRHHVRYVLKGKDVLIIPMPQDLPEPVLERLDQAGIKNDAGADYEIHFISSKTK